MFCHKCGTEIPSDDASFCINCRAPLLKIQSPANNSSAGFGSNARDPNPSSINLSFGDDDEALKMSDPIDFLMQENEENEQKEDPSDLYKKEFQDGFQDEIEEETQDTAQDEVKDTGQYGIQDSDRDESQYAGRDEVQDMGQYGIQDSARDETRDSNRDEVQDTGQYGVQNSGRDETQDTNQDEMQNAGHYEIQDSAHDETQDSSQDEVQDAGHYEIQDSGQEETRDSYQDEMQDAGQYATQDSGQDETRDPSQDEMQDAGQYATQDSGQDEIQDPSKDEMQDTDRDKMRQVGQDGIQNDVKENTPQSLENQNPAGQTPPMVSTNKTEPPVENRPKPVFAGKSAGSSLGTGFSSSGKSGNAVQAVATKQEEKKMPPPLQFSGMEEPNKRENIIATTKIDVNKQKNDDNIAFKLSSSTSKLDNVKTPSDPTSLDINKIKRSNGIAYLTGNNISFAGGPKITPGTEIHVGENSYEVKLKPKSRNELYALIGSVAVSIFVTLYFLGVFNTSPYGDLVGLVVGADSRPMANQVVKIKETGDKFTTNSAGFFIFNDLHEGIYTVEYLSGDEIIGEERITVLGGKTSTIRLSRNISGRSSSVRPEPATRQKTQYQQTVAAVDKQPATVKKKGVGGNKAQPQTVRCPVLS